MPSRYSPWRPFSSKSGQSRLAQNMVLLLPRRLSPRLPVCVSIGTMTGEKRLDVYQSEGPPVADLAREGWLLERAADGEVSLFLTSWKGPVVVLGYGQSGRRRRPRVVPRGRHSCRAPVHRRYGRRPQR